MATEWKVEGVGPTTKIRAICHVCHYGATIPGNDLLEPSLKVIQQTFQHGPLCKGLAEPIPPEIREKYWNRTVVSQV
jgi:hypothetical protein